ncbi:MAG: hypothetical protein ACE5IJ_10990, partial [Thermoplasmata archaeon]
VVHDFQLLDASRKMLRDGGKVIVTVPLDDRCYLPEDHHLRYYTYNSLGKIMFVTGFRDIEIKDGTHSRLATGVRK